MVDESFAFDVFCQHLLSVAFVALICHLALWPLYHVLPSLDGNSPFALLLPFMPLMRFVVTVLRPRLPLIRS